jgi:hypothetical protein
VREEEEGAWGKTGEALAPGLLQNLGLTRKGVRRVGERKKSCQKDHRQ